MRLPSNDYEFVSLIPLALFVLFRRIQDRLLRRRLQIQHTSAYVSIRQHARFVLYTRIQDRLLRKRLQIFLWGGHSARPQNGEVKHGIGRCIKKDSPTARRKACTL
jgi:hypothetical protein